MERAAVESVARLPVRGAVPIAVPPSKKVTLPVGPGTPEAVVVTAAVSVRACPRTEGLGADTRTVEVGALATVCVRTADVEAEKFVSPLYMALMEWPPPVRADVVSVATLPEIAVVPSAAAPSSKVTVPIGEAGAGAT